MSGDKRSVSTDALETLGTIIDEKAGRDAIHLAVEPVIASQKLYPAQDIGLREDGQAIALPEGHPKAVGIVDPFLKASVQPGERFWLVVYPRQITSLRHVWTHPAFPEPATIKFREQSEKWLRNFCDSRNLPYEDTLYMAAACSDEYICFGFEIDCDRDIPSEFWDHVEAITGKKSPVRASYFRCAC